MDRERATATKVKYQPAGKLSALENGDDSAIMQRNLDDAVKVMHRYSSWLVMDIQKRTLHAVWLAYKEVDCKVQRSYAS